MTPQRRKKDSSGSAPVGTCDWCKQSIKKGQEKKWRGLLFHADCYKYGKKGWNKKKVKWPERNWTNVAGGEPATPEEEQRRIKILGRIKDGGVDGDDDGTSGEGRDAT